MRPMAAPRLAAALFADLVDSTETIARLGPQPGEVWRQGSLALLRESVAAASGREVQHTGDGLFAVFESASQAALAARAMQRGAMQASRRRDASAPIALRIGVSAGEVTEDDEGVHGLVVVEAARLCAAARSGQILASALVQTLCSGHGEPRFESVGALELKGLPAPVVAVAIAWDAQGGAPAPFPSRLAELVQSSFVGRDKERSRLADAWRSAAAGERRVVLVAGEPGIGKTRLAAELGREAHAQGALVLYGRCDEDLGAPYQPWVHALGHYASLAAPDELKRLLSEGGAEIARIVPEVMRRLPGLEVPAASDPESARFALFESIDALLAAASRGAPILVVLDDLHWADKPSLVLLRHVIRSQRDAALLVVATYRETDLSRTHPLAEVLADLRRESRVERVLLRGLDRADLAALVASRAQQEPLHTETEGNPFFVEEVLRHLVETGALRREGDRWTGGPISALGIPESVRDVIGRRLSRLSDAANRALGVAAVIGRDFDVALVEAVGGLVGDALLDAMDEALRARLVRETEVHGRLSFSHALVRQTLYEELGTLRRVKLHWQIGEAIERRHADAIDEHLSALAYHFGEGAASGDPLRSVDWSLRAGAQAAALVAHEEALAHYRHALATLDQADLPDPERRYEALMGVGRAAIMLGDLTLLSSSLYPAARLAKAQGWVDRQARATVEAASFVRDEALYGPELVELIDEALAALPPGDSRERAMLTARKGMHDLLRRTQLDAHASVDEAIEMARRLGEDEALSVVLNVKVMLLFGTPRVAEMERIGREFEEMAARVGDLRRVALAQRAPVYRALALGRRDEFEARLTDVRAASNAARSSSALYFPVFWDAMTALAEGRFDDAKGFAAKARDLVRRDPGFDFFYAGHVGARRFEQGREGDVIPGLVRFLEGGGEWRQTQRAMLANALAAVGRSEEARREIAVLRGADWAGLPRDWGLPLALRHLSEAVARLGASDAARTLEPLAAPYGGQLLVPYNGFQLEGAGDRALALCAATSGRLDEADALYAKALALEDGFRAPALAARTRYWWARALVERDASSDREHARARAVESLETARRFGMASLARDAEALVGELG
jgi:class 3 adenylate cyclase/tetratricopeptide (TPR) repeat protein